jgi:predicted nuclease of restriction endonuclease-like RecB superfamily
MSFRLADLKKSVRKGRDGHVITPVALEGRSAAFRVGFVLEQLEDHLGKPRKLLDPQVLLEFVGDARLGRALLATLAQWYRTRPLTFPEVLGEGAWRERFEALELRTPVELRAWLYAAINSEADGYLDPDVRSAFWGIRARSLGVRREDLYRLTLLDRPDEAVLVRTGPRPSGADVLAAYNARAHTTLLRSAVEVALRCDTAPGTIDAAAALWATSLGVEWRREGSILRLLGHADALGCWTRHGRRIERAALELLALPELQVTEIEGRVIASEKQPRFRWSGTVLDTLGAATGAVIASPTPERIDALAQLLRRERDRSDGAPWGIRRPAHVIGVDGAVCLPHLELRRGDRTVYLRLGAGGEWLRAYAGKTPLALVEWDGSEELRLHPAGGGQQSLPVSDLLPTLAEHYGAAAPAVPARRAA